MLNIRVDRKEFLRNISIVENAINDDKANGINSGIFVETKDNKLVLKGMGEGLFIKASMNCDVLEEGEFVIKHKLMEEFLKQIEEDIIEIKETNGKINIITGKNSSEFAIYEYEKRNDPNINLGFEISFNKNDFLLDIENVKFAVSNQIDRQAINCVRLEMSNNGLTLVASDTHRLIHINKEFENQRELESLSISIPLRSVQGLIKIMKLLNDDKLIFKSDGSKAMFMFENTLIITKLVEIQYPDFKTLLNSIRSNKKVLVNTKEIIGLLKRVSVFVKDNQDKKDVAVFNFENDILEISARNDLAFSNEKINIHLEGENLKIALNTRYILEYLQTIQNEKLIEIKMFDERTPILISPQNRNDNIYLVAPTQI